MNEQRRQRMLAVEAEKRKNAGLPAIKVEAIPTIIWGKHFFIETQADEQGDDCYAIYRATDLLCSEPGATEPAPPVHICDEVTDAGTIVAVLDAIVARDEPDAKPIELPGAKQEEVVQ